MKSITETDIRHLERGFSLVELMIALVLGLIVVGGSLTLFVSQRATSGLSNQMAEVQADGRIAMDALARDLRTAGDFGCWPVTNPIDKKLNSDNAFDINKGGLLGYDKQALLPTDKSSAYGLTKVSDSLVAASPDSLANTSSIVALTGIFGSLSQLTSGMTNQASQLVVKVPTQDFKNSDVAVITDCINWAKFQITGVVTDATTKTQTINHAQASSDDAATYGKGNKDNNIGEVFNVGATVGRLDTVWWFMGKVGDQTGLFRMSSRDGIPTLVSSRVAAINVSYDISTSEQGTITAENQTAASVGSSWQGVRSATIRVLMRSEKIGNAGAQTVTSFVGQTVPTDNHVYLPLQMTVVLRNQ